MPRELTVASRWAAVAALLLAAVLVERSVHAASTSALVLQGVVALLAVLGGVKMWLHNCFESHLVVVLAVAATAIGTVLSLTLGMPGSARTDLSAAHVVTFVLSAAIGVLLVADARARGATR
ncbi:hypothetical protein [Knoellia aerolata]|uniref:Uncharacterized protein n=1 Tax=Knoellia aerolata DSM 18566 TaxID=1385519 RepID=A0A0A0JYL4_9MICO|nr:hypothetical protein [Knoellia aerolata]KGN42283.1 hypothetical protein N801_00505 [Knoellia aerolata DSM 18566]